MPGQQTLLGKVHVNRSHDLGEPTWREAPIARELEHAGHVE